eukprot:CAMPEP_0119435316 /NCGR_PEP_ID=MMETSP1335-20130426/51110_1 /TAXON_ID=259385 /ORGANISM="Chrysoculter rhomboideus, Strain RCC1486" /LENGTH=83 /DNA_ID=CAMNT_0007461175 /DNA_START=276 /DNA_END=527 /DNA_ORIENTATION=+
MRLTSFLFCRAPTASVRAGGARSGRLAGGLGVLPQGPAGPRRRKFLAEWRGSSKRYMTGCMRLSTAEGKDHCAWALLEAEPSE